jgi:hypothetical protein
MFVDKSAAARLSVNQDQLRPISMAQGWLVTVDISVPSKPIFKAIPAALAPVEKPRRCFWFFDEEQARAYVAGMAVDWTRKSQIPILKNGDGKPLPFGESGPMKGGVECATDGTLALSAAFMETIPDNMAGAGNHIGHSSSPPRIGHIVGGYRYGADGRVTLVLDRRLFWWGWTLKVTASGDDEYRPAVQPIMLDLLAVLNQGAPQKLAFAEIADQELGAEPVELSAESDAGIPVEFIVINGPMAVDGRSLRQLDVPPRTKLPLEVRVAAYNFGRHVPGHEPIKKGGWILRSFKILPRGSSK